MPFRRRKPRTARRKTNRRPYKRRERRSNRSTFPTRGLSTIPDKLFTTMQYSDVVAIQATTGVPQAYQFQTSAFDPNLTGVGHQPLGFDQWSTFYTKYRVHGIKYKVTFVNTSTTFQADVAVIPKNVSTVITNPNTLWERAYGKKRICGVEGSGQAVKAISGYLNPARALGFSKLQYNTDDLTMSNIASSPSTMAFLQLYVNDVAATDTIIVNARVELTYYTEFLVRQVLGES